jgi:hypothetical protein
MAKEFKNKVIDHYSVTLDSEDGSEPKKLKLCFDYGAIARIEEATGIDIKKSSNWPIPSSKFPEVFWGGLRRFNPEVTLDEVRSFLNPDVESEMYYDIFFLMFPHIKEEVDKKLKEQETGATASPNAVTATPSI